MKVKVHLIIAWAKPFGLGRVTIRVLLPLLSGSSISLASGSAKKLSHQIESFESFHFPEGGNRLRQLQAINQIEIKVTYRTAKMG